jgi:cytidylate kinase
VKIFLTASSAVRARRRWEELTARGAQVGYEETLHELEERDRRDATRATAPLKQADDAVAVDTSDLALESVVDRLEALARERLGL